MLAKVVQRALKDREFLHVATADTHRQPNAAPKLLLKFDDTYVYLVDYTIGRTWRNLKVNPRASLSFVDPRTLTGYQLNGRVKIIDKGLEYDRIRDEVLKRQVSLTARHIIEDMAGKDEKHEDFELSMSSRFLILKVKVMEVAEIGISGGLRRSKTSEGKKGK